MKLFNVKVKMVSSTTSHSINIRARSADEAMTQIIIQMAPHEVLEMRVKEVKL